MFGDITDLITANANNVDKLNHIKKLVEDFNSKSMPNTLQYIKIIDEISEVLDIGKDGRLNTKLRLD